MILCLTDEYATVRTVERSDAEFAVHELPARITTAAAFTGRWVANEAPDTVVVATSLIDDPGDRTAVVYRLTLGDETWIPDILFDHDHEALGVAAGSRHPGTESRIPPAAAAAAAAAIALLGPARVLVVATGAAAKSRLPDLVLDLGRQALEHHRRGRRRSEGGDHVPKAVRIGGGLAERLRLTKTQRARFLQAVRSAAVRGGGVPAPLSAESEVRANTKTEAKRRLEELEARLQEWKRADV